MTDDNDINEHPPDEDIDQHIENCNVRIERMDGGKVWLAAYTHDEEEAEHHYNIDIRDGGLHITHEKI